MDTSDTQVLFDLVTHSPEQTIAFGRELAKELEATRLVLLEGELGSGKTTLIKGIVAGLGAAAEEQVNSPTFTLIHEYTAARNGRTVYHVDLYRLDEPRDLASLGLEELLDQSAMVIVEWGEKFENIGLGARIRIRLEHVGSEDRRIVVERLED